jgi:hypothetical protein
MQEIWANFEAAVSTFEPRQIDLIENETSY